MERLTNLDKRKSVIDAEMEKCRAIIKKIYEEEAAEELKRRLSEEEELRRKQKEKEREENERKRKEKEQLKKNFPYTIYDKNCSHVVKSNTIPIFACCNKAYPCATCHGWNYHPPTITLPSYRYCMNCFEIYYV